MLQVHSQEIDLLSLKIDGTTTGKQIETIHKAFAAEVEATAESGLKTSGSRLP